MKYIPKRFKNKHLHTSVSFTNGRTRLTEDKRLTRPFRRKSRGRE